MSLLSLWTLLLDGCQWFKSSSVTTDAFIVDEPCRLNFQKNLKAAQFPAEFLLPVDCAILLIFYNSRLRVGVCGGSYGKTNPPSASDSLYLSVLTLNLLPLSANSWTSVSADFSLCILYDTSSDLSLGTTCYGNQVRIQLMEKYSIVLFSDTGLFCSNGLFMKQERVHVRIERVHLYKTEWEKLYCQTGPGCWGRCLALLFCLYSNKSKLTCVVIGVEQQVQKNNSAANSNERVSLIPSGRYWEDNREPCQQLN